MSQSSTSLPLFMETKRGQPLQASKKTFLFWGPTSSPRDTSMHRNEMHHKSPQIFHTSKQLQSCTHSTFQPSTHVVQSVVPVIHSLRGGLRRVLVMYMDFIRMSIPLEYRLSASNVEANLKREVHRRVKASSALQ